jgi:hypothetical protein
MECTYMHAWVGRLMPDGTEWRKLLELCAVTWSYRSTDVELLQDTDVLDTSLAKAHKFLNF